MVLAGTEYQSNQTALPSFSVKQITVEKVVNNAARKAFEQQTVKLAVDNVFLRMQKKDHREENNSSSGVSSGSRDEVRTSSGEGGMLGSDDTDQLHGNVFSSDVMYTRVKQILVSYASPEEIEEVK